MVVTDDELNLVSTVSRNSGVSIGFQKSISGNRYRSVLMCRADGRKGEGLRGNDRK